MSKQVAVVIPSYKAVLTVNEEIVLKQAERVLKKYDMYFILPYALTITYARKEILEKRYKEEFFPQCVPIQ